MDIADPAVAYEQLKRETAEMFGYDLANLSLTQGLQLDLVSLLRLEVDTMQGAVLAGEKVDLQRLVAAHGLLRQMLPAQALVAPAAAADHDFSGAHAELARLLDGRIEALEHKMARDPDAARAEFEAKLQRAIEKHSSRDVFDASNTDALKTACSDASQNDEGVTLPPSAAPDAPAGGGEPPVLIESPDHRRTVRQTPPPPPPPRRSVEEVNAEPPPDHYLKQPDGEWRQFIGPDGEIRSPWFVPHG
jgi:hypothetical protein